MTSRENMSDTLATRSAQPNKLHVHHRIQDSPGSAGVESAINQYKAHYCSSYLTLPKANPRSLGIWGHTPRSAVAVAVMIIIIDSPI